VIIPVSKPSPNTIQFAAMLMALCRYRELPDIAALAEPVSRVTLLRRSAIGDVSVVRVDYPRAIDRRNLTANGGSTKRDNAIATGTIVVVANAARYNSPGSEVRLRNHIALTKTSRGKCIT
jgi:hypothetical protein